MKSFRKNIEELVKVKNGEEGANEFLKNMFDAVYF
ncbi:MAG: hypothetical protein MRERC_9c022 [Mycoplasmataceae bacterium RC_NB112A]|nr:MAG: hypothetical protein MRERC_9c022 [Mycoplasmataceae bacterium RC_NB112A]